MVYRTYHAAETAIKGGHYELDKNTFGAPKEAYGFSNNAKGSFDAPDYEKTAFNVDKSKMTVRITVKYRRGK